MSNEDRTDYRFLTFMVAVLLMLVIWAEGIEDLGAAAFNAINASPLAVKAVLSAAVVGVAVAIYRGVLK